jgi:hypothetical protein
MSYYLGHLHEVTTLKTQTRSHALDEPETFTIASDNDKEHADLRRQMKVFPL